MSNSLTGDKGFYGWTNLATTSVVGVVGALYLISFGYFLPYLVEDFGWNRGTASLASTINMIAMGLSGPIAGMFIMKYGARRAIVIGNSLGFLGFLLLYFHSHLWELFLGYGVFIGLAAGLGGLLASTTVINNWFVKKRGLALSIFLGSGGAVGVFTGRAIMKIIETTGWRVTFLIISFTVLGLAVILPGILIRNKPQDLGQIPDGSGGPEIPDRRKQIPPRAAYKTPVDFTAKEALRTRCLWLLIAYFCLNMLAMNALMTHQVAYMFDIGVNAATAGTALGVMSGFMAFSQLSVGFLGMRYSMHSIAIGAEVLKIIGLVILLLTQSLLFVFVYMVVLGLGFGAVMAATMNIFPNYFGASNYPKIMGSVRLFWAFVGGAGAPLAGHIRDISGSYLYAFQGALVVIVVGLACLVFAKPPVHPSLREPQPAEVYSPAAQLEI